MKDMRLKLIPFISFMFLLSKSVLLVPKFGDEGLGD